MTVLLLDAAGEDLDAAFAYYEAKRPGLGRQLVNEFRKGVDRILQFPDAWQPLDEVYRRYRLHRFPYGIVYR